MIILSRFRDKCRRKNTLESVFLLKKGFQQSLPGNKRPTLVDESERNQPFIDRVPTRHGQKLINPRYWIDRPSPVPNPHTGTKTNTHNGREREKKKATMAATWWGGKKPGTSSCLRDGKKPKGFTQQLKLNRWEPGESLAWVPSSQQTKLVNLVTCLLLVCLFRGLWRGQSWPSPSSRSLANSSRRLVSRISDQNQTRPFQEKKNVEGLLS